MAVEIERMFLLSDSLKLLDGVDKEGLYHTCPQVGAGGSTSIRVLTPSPNIAFLFLKE